MGIQKTSAVSNIKLLLGLMVFLWGHVTAVSQIPRPELIYVYFDKPFYVAGESIHYKVYFLYNNPIVSELVHLELVDDDGFVMDEQHLMISGNSASGTIELPVSIQEGMYTARCYTLWNLNFGGEFIFYKDLPIYDAWKEPGPPQDVDLFLRDSIKPYKVSDSGDIDIMLTNEGKIHPGDNVSISIIIKENGSANLSVSVYDLNLLRPGNQAKHAVSENLKSGALLTEPQRVHEPERSLRVYGRLIDPDTKEPLNSNVISVFDRSEMVFTRLKSKDGFFTLELPLFEGKKVLQIINMNPFQTKVPEVEIIRYGSMFSSKEYPGDLPERSSEINKYLYYSRIRSKIGEIFQDDILDSLKSMPVSLPGFEPDRTYDMSEYRLVKNVEEFINEGVTNATTFKKDGQQKLKLFNTETKKFFMTEPWMMVDGQFIFNDSLAYNIPFSNVRRIDVFTTTTSLMKYFDPIMIQGGVIAVYTNNNYLEDYIELLPNLITVPGVFNDPGIYSSDSRVNTFGQGPDLDPMIYWNPSVLTDDEGKASMDFRMNDITGDCLIVVEGTDLDGNYIVGELMYRVYP